MEGVEALLDRLLVVVDAAGGLATLQQTGRPACGGEGDGFRKECPNLCDALFSFLDAVVWPEPFRGRPDASGCTTSSK